MNIDVKAKSYRVPEKYHETKSLFFLTLLDFEDNSKNGTPQV